MKTLKFILPVVAIMAAVAGVFATGNSAPVATYKNVTALSSYPCTIDGTCDIDQSTKLCKLVSGTQFREVESNTVCSSVVTYGAFVAIQP